MDLTRHCELCNHQEISFKEGSTCGLTGNKPDFDKRCLNIRLSEKFETKLKAVNVEYEKVKKTKTVIYTYFIVFVMIGVGVITGAYFLGKYTFDKGVASTIPLTIMGIGLLPVIMAVSTLKKHIQEMDVVRNKKKRVDEVLKCYGLEYEIDVMFGKEYHGKQEITVDLKVMSKTN